MTDAGGAPTRPTPTERVSRRWPAAAVATVAVVAAAVVVFAERRGGTGAGGAVEGHPPVATRAPTAVEGASLWGQYCAACHDFAAAGRSPLGPVLVSREYLAWASDERLDSLMTFGVPGTAMLGWGRERGGMLDERQRRSILLHLRRLQPTAPSDPGWRGRPTTPAR